VHSNERVRPVVYRGEAASSRHETSPTENQTVDLSKWERIGPSGDSCDRIIAELVRTHV